MEVTAIDTEDREALVRAAQEGDAGAFERLYRREVGRTYALCLRMVGDRREAERLTQDAFVRAWQSIGSFRGDSAFSTWMHRLTVNVVLGHLRGRRRRRARFDSVERPQDHDRRAQPSTGSHRLDLEEALASLPPQARAVVVLHDVEGYTHREIGDVLGIAPGTSKAHLHRARNLLRAYLKR